LTLKQLSIGRQQWGDDKGKLVGSVTFVDSRIETSIILSEEIAAKMLDLLAGQLIDNAKEISQSLSGIANYNLKAIEGSTE